MTVSWYYIFFLVMIIVVSAIVMGKQYDYKPKNKNVELLVNLFVYFLSGISLSFVLFNGLLTWWTIFLSLVIGVIVSFSLAAVLNRETRLYDDSAQYTTEELIGKHGIISSLYGPAQYLGKLKDDNKTDIVVIIYEECKPGDMFEIKEINGEGIIAKIIKF
jgi:membrane protein implicated in regulation of membrane protease activity